MSYGQRQLWFPIAEKTVRPGFTFPAGRTFDV
jgi:hypothetical protein